MSSPKAGNGGNGTMKGVDGTDKALEGGTVATLVDAEALRELEVVPEELVRAFDSLADSDWQHRVQLDGRVLPDMLEDMRCPSCREWSIAAWAKWFGGLDADHLYDREWWESLADLIESLDMELPFNATLHIERQSGSRKGNKGKRKTAAGGAGSDAAAPETAAGTPAAPAQVPAVDAPGTESKPGDGDSGKQGTTPTSTKSGASAGGAPSGSGATPASSTGKKKRRRKKRKGGSGSNAGNEHDAEAGPWDIDWLQLLRLPTAAELGVSEEIADEGHTYVLRPTPDVALPAAVGPRKLLEGVVRDAGVPYPHDSGTATVATVKAPMSKIAKTAPCRFCSREPAVDLEVLSARWCVIIRWKLALTTIAKEREAVLAVNRGCARLMEHRAKFRVLEAERERREAAGELEESEESENLRTELFTAISEDSTIMFCSSYELCQRVLQRLHQQKQRDWSGMEAFADLPGGANKPFQREWSKMHYWFERESVDTQSEDTVRHQLDDFMRRQDEANAAGDAELAAKLDDQFWELDWSLYEMQWERIDWRISVLNEQVAMLSARLYEEQLMACRALVEDAGLPRSLLTAAMAGAAAIDDARSSEDNSSPDGDATTPAETPAAPATTDAETTADDREDVADSEAAAAVAAEDHEGPQGAEDGAVVAAGGAGGGDASLSNAESAVDSSEVAEKLLPPVDKRLLAAADDYEADVRELVARGLEKGARRLREFVAACLCSSLVDAFRGDESERTRQALLADLEAEAQSAERKRTKAMRKKERARLAREEKQREEEERKRAAELAARKAEEARRKRERQREERRRRAADGTTEPKKNQAGPEGGGAARTRTAVATARQRKGAARSRSAAAKAAPTKELLSRAPARSVPQSPARAKPGPQSSPIGVSAGTERRRSNPTQKLLHSPVDDSGASSRASASARRTERHRGKAEVGRSAQPPQKALPPQKAPAAPNVKSGDAATRPGVAVGSATGASKRPKQSPVKPGSAADADGPHHLSNGSGSSSRTASPAAEAHDAATDGTKHPPAAGSDAAPTINGERRQRTRPGAIGALRRPRAIGPRSPVGSASKGARSPIGGSGRSGGISSTGMPVGGLGVGGVGSGSFAMPSLLGGQFNVGDDADAATSRLGDGEITGPANSGRSSPRLSSMWGGFDDGPGILGGESGSGLTPSSWLQSALRPPATTTPDSNEASPASHSAALAGGSMGSAASLGEVGSPARSDGGGSAGGDGMPPGVTRTPTAAPMGWSGQGPAAPPPMQFGVAGDVGMAGVRGGGFHSGMHPGHGMPIGYGGHVGVCASGHGVAARGGVLGGPGAPGAGMATQARPVIGPPLPPPQMGMAPFGYARPPPGIAPTASPLRTDHGAHPGSNGGMGALPPGMGGYAPREWAGGPPPGPPGVSHSPYAGPVRHPAAPQQHAPIGPPRGPQ